MTTIEAVSNEQKLNAFLDRVVNDLAGGYAGVMVVLGRKLGLYRALAAAGPATSTEIAERSGCAERYVREWLNSQVAAGYVDYDPESGGYDLSPEQALVLADESSTVYMPMAWEIPASMWHDEDKTLEAFRTGKGVPWSAHHPRLFNGVAAFYRNGYEAALVQQWLPSLDGVVEKLERGAAVADVGCGFGYSTLIMAKAFPQSRFLGLDTHVESIEEARKEAERAGVTNVDFTVGELSGASGPWFDLVCFFDALHDLGNPLGAAQQARRALKPDGAVLLVEPFANDRLEDNINVVGRLYYAASTVLCVPHSLSEETGLALGAQAGESRLAELFSKAGYSAFRRASEAPFNLIFEART
jgi:SAM-dependent methyltransferase